MDTITHTLFGLVIYNTLKTEEMSQPMKRAFLFTSLVGSQIPDIDVISQAWDTEGLYLMWHRGLTHSVFLVPIWAFLISLLAYLFWRVRDRRLFWIGLLAVFVHDTIDNFNAWGTGYLEPFSETRVTFGTISIVDPMMWLIILGGYLSLRLKKWRRHTIFRTVAALLVAHVAIQSAEGAWLYQANKASYDSVVLFARFVPGQFHLIGKKEGLVEISEVSVWNGGAPKLLMSIPSADQADLTELFAKNPEAKTLSRWSPMLVVVDDGQRLGIYDPRFVRNGESFLYEYIER
ncbi:metal-dependent hydrolase [Brevibacillus dissolubilis]|uniref:metal-dependent hydrolase n=1 Tax=Brevibacillus dissolubilis TaxID=1844116 RepID=UPI001117323D|nr:metal-dependent hydrolase [Brevibacillus dissolubilis]